MPDTLAILIDRGASLADLAAHSNPLSREERVAQMRALSAGQLKKLWELADGQQSSVDLEYLLPEKAPRTAVWEGQNSLPMFRAFTKRFTHDKASEGLTGHNTGSMQWLVGPGYFTAVQSPKKAGEFLLDYTRYPQATPPGWPELRKNEAGISRLVFARMHDYLRPVGDHLAIGAAYLDDGKFRNQYFALARGEVLDIGC